MKPTINAPIKTSYAIPMDVMMDIAQILLQSDIQHTITDIRKSKNAIVIEMMIEPRHRMAEENIHQILEDYNYYRYGEQQLEYED